MDSTIIISNHSDIAQFSSAISSYKNLTKFGVDLEGDNLCRHGKISYIQLYASQIRTFYIFECADLSKDDVKNALGSLFERKTIVKYMFDCRSDVDALYHQYGIKMNGVVDVQLWEIGYRKCSGFGGKYYIGLFRTLTSYKNQLGIPNDQLAVKDKFCLQFKEKNYQLDLNEPNVLTYLKVDVAYLEGLFLLFNTKMIEIVKQSILRETEKRQNIWMLPQYVKDKSNAISVI